MGNTESVQTPRQSRQYKAPSEKLAIAPAPTPASADNLAEELSRLILSSKTRISSTANPISTDSLNEWETEVLADPKNRLAQAAITKGAIANVIKNPKVFQNDSVHVFSELIANEGAPITNQHSSGRCWLFASTSLLRIGIQSRLKIDEFQLSQSFLFFYDKLEKCNYFLQNLIETADYDLDSRLLTALLQDDVSDGGQWDFLINIIQKYGLVPRTVFPESFSSDNSYKIDFIISNKIREFGLNLRKAKLEQNADITTLSVLKEKYMQEIFNILTITFGSPPKPNDTFTWEYTDTYGKYHSITTTPLGFYEDIVKFDVSSYFSLIHDPRNPYDELYTVDRNNNMQGGKPLEFVNVPIDVLKQAAITAIQNDEAVFFGSDVGQFSDSLSGIMDTEAWDYQLAYNTKFNLDKADRVRLGLSQMTHAMLLTGVDIVDGKPVKWKVMNSWGTDVGDKGFFTMSDKWFDEYVYQVVTTPKFIGKKYTDIWKAKDFKVLPRWDPYGSLA
ncbi:uncharacterized protein SAPINGB_P005817 [Magnusiomyces paraingens]|uniref:Cysteine proteinase 1, mitochondrial n=1 Tax=Magnusiomyces paraingens TaxID=2606893 RepID=A0A5E8C2V5_9ASCO|nr:uncharacterized protein SAPINGB_P005817 [Saprochaete ingens]VVT57682.1 unnamed protein product [Saprochaete ingens]